LSHTTRVERHAAVDIISSAAGGALVAAVLQKSWLCALVAAALGAAVFIFDRMSIEEDEIEFDPEPYSPPTPPPFYLHNIQVPQDYREMPDRVYKRIMFEAARDTEGIQSDEPLLIYHNGLQDGVITFAQWLKEEIGDSR
jgi:hypothetical protein